jgi:hypothetical protein
MVVVVVADMIDGEIAASHIESTMLGVGVIATSKIILIKW